jgi:hypothetical protein
MQNLGRSDRFVHVSVRIPEKLVLELHNEARRQGINFNALINRLLLKFIEFDRIYEHGRSVILDKRVFVPLLDKIKEEELRNIGLKLGPILTKETMEFFDIEFTLESLFSRYLEPMGRHSGEFRFNGMSQGRKIGAVLEHEYGRKWSIFLAEYTKGIMKSVLGTEPRIEVEDDIVSIQFPDIKTA